MRACWSLLFFVLFSEGSITTSKIGERSAAGSFLQDLIEAQMFRLACSLTASTNIKTLLCGGL